MHSVFQEASLFTCLCDTPLTDQHECHQHLLKSPREHFFTDVAPFRAHAKARFPTLPRIISTNAEIRPLQYLLTSEDRVLAARRRAAEADHRALVYPNQMGS